MKKEILKTFFGVSEIPDRIIATPISSIFSEFGKYIRNPNQYNGWWECTMGVVDDDVMLIKCHPGSTIIDITKAITSPDRRILFSGYCGGLSSNLKIGDIVIAAESVIEGDGNYGCGFSLPYDRDEISEMKVCRNISVKSILDETREGLSGFDTVDMETGHVYKIFEGERISTMVVTDLPWEKPFYELESKEKDLVREAISRMVYKSMETFL